MDLTSELLPKLQAHSLPGLKNIGDGLQHPQYDGGSILNLAPTICRLFGVPELGANGALDEAIFSPLKDLASEPKTIVLILMDALALHRLQRWLENDGVPLWRKLLENGLLAPLTSVVPSTTSCAIPTIWSGLSPAEHGFVGYELWLQEYGVVANMITHSPFQIPGSLEKAGFKPELALAGPSLSAHLALHEVKSYAFQHFAIANSGMSRMFLQGAEVRGFGVASELAVNLRQLLEQDTHVRKFVWVYWGNVDRLSHLYGPDDERPEGEFRHFTQAMEAFLFDRLSAQARAETLFILTADHGQITTPKHPHFETASHPNLTRRLPIQPVGENRLPYFFVRPGQMEAVREYLDRTFMKQFIQLDPGYALENGLFGPGEPHPRIRERLGDLLLVPKRDAYLWWSKRENPLLGRHGGMHPEEMLVPFLAAHL